MPALVRATEAHLMPCQRPLMKSVNVNYVLIMQLIFFCINFAFTGKKKNPFLSLKEAFSYGWFIGIAIMQSE